MNLGSEASFYPAAKRVSAKMEKYFAFHAGQSLNPKSAAAVAVPERKTIEAMIDKAFWASLQREEGYATKISMAYISPAEACQPIMFEEPLPLDSQTLVKISPAVGGPGVYLGIWRDAQNRLSIWGLTRLVPQNCFVLEISEPGLLVIKHRTKAGQGKFANVLILSGEQIKEIDEHGTSLADCPDILASMLRFVSSAVYDDSAGVTAAFNMNLIGRINRELGGTVPEDAFRHRAIWNDDRARIEMHLEATRDVTFMIEGRPFDMAAGETIHTENSHK